MANEDLGDSLDSVEALFKKHDDFEKSLTAQEEKIKALDEFATKLIESEHYAHDDVAARRDQLLTRRNRLYEASTLRRHLLEESYKFQTFQRDCDETKSWINEKLKTASDENYLVSLFSYWYFPGCDRPKSLKLVVVAFPLGIQDYGNSTTTGISVSG